MMSTRHEDAGVVELFRSASGRLPPAYLSWDNQEDIYSPGVATQDSKLQPEDHPAARTDHSTVRELPSPPSSAYRDIEAH